MWGTVDFDGSISEPLPINSGLKQVCTLIPMLFGIFFSLLLSHAWTPMRVACFFTQEAMGICSTLCNSKQRWRFGWPLSEMLFADDASLVAHFEAILQELISHFVHACTNFGLIINLKNTNIMGLDIWNTPSISISDQTLEVVEEFTYLSSQYPKVWPWKWTWTNTLVMQHQWWHTSPLGYWRTPCCPTTPRWRCTRPAYSALYCTAVRHGHLMPHRSTNSFHLCCLRRNLGVTW